MNTNQLTEEITESIFQLQRCLREKATFDSGVINLSLLQLKALMYIAHKPTPMTEIADYFKIELPTATSLVQKLVSMKLVKRQVGTEDRRVIRIVLSSQGEELLSKTKREYLKRMNANLSYLSTNDKTSLLKILKKVLKNIEN